eukprot:tig00021127_g18870.t1
MDSTHFGDAPRRRTATNSILQELTDIAAVNSFASAERDALNSLSNTEQPTLIDCGGGIYITGRSAEEGSDDDSVESEQEESVQLHVVGWPKHDFA